MNTKKKHEFLKIKDYVFNKQGVNSIEALYESDQRILNVKTDEIIDKIKYHSQKKSTFINVGDYDVDGITSSFCLQEILKALGVDIKNFSFRHPKREEGYGLKDVLTSELISKSPDIVILYDNGITAVENVKRLTDEGIDVLIIDHHQLREDGIYPESCTILNPEVFPSQADFQHYCTAGLMFKIAEKLFISKQMSPDSFCKVKSFAAIGTVGDMVPMIKENRRIVIEGLKTLTKKKGRTVGLEALLKKFYLTFSINEKDIGFKVAPCLNALGRIEKDGAKKTYDIVSFDDNSEEGLIKAEENAEYIISKNNERKDLVAKHLEEVLNQAESQKDDKIIICKILDIPEGIIGILAANIVEKYGSAAIVFTNTEKELKGSGRAPENSFHLKNFLNELSPLIIGFGGHEGAAGLSVSFELFDEFVKKAKEKSEEKEFSFEKKDKNVYFYDFEMPAKYIVPCAKELQKFAPYGQGFPEPIFLLNDVEIEDFEYFEKNKTLVKGILKKELSFNEKCFGLNFKDSEIFSKYSKVTMNVLSTIEMREKFKENEYLFFFNDFEIIDSEKIEVKAKIDKKERKSQILSILSEI